MTMFGVPDIHHLARRRSTSQPSGSLALSYSFDSFNDWQNGSPSSYASELISGGDPYSYDQQAVSVGHAPPSWMSATSSNSISSSEVPGRASSSTRKSSKHSSISLPTRPSQDVDMMTNSEGEMSEFEDTDTIPSPTVKSEPDDHFGNFILEMSLNSPPTMSTPSSMEAPLRATNACDDMRKLMSVIRLNPFTVQNGNGAVRTWKYGDDEGGIGPLREEGRQIEFQVELSQPLIPEDELENRSPSPLTPLPEEGSVNFPSPHLSVSPVSFDELAPTSYVTSQNDSSVSIQSLSQPMFTLEGAYTDPLRAIYAAYEKVSVVAPSPVRPSNGPWIQGNGKGTSDFMGYTSQTQNVSSIGLLNSKQNNSLSYPYSTPYIKSDPSASLIYDNHTFFQVV